MEDARVWRWPAGHSWAALRDSDSVPRGVASLSYPQQQSELRSVTWLFRRSAHHSFHLRTTGSWLPVSLHSAIFIPGQLNPQHFCYDNAIALCVAFQFEQGIPLGYSFRSS